MIISIQAYQNIFVILRANENSLELYEWSWKLIKRNDQDIDTAVKS